MSKVLHNKLCTSSTYAFTVKMATLSRQNLFIEGKCRRVKSYPLGTTIPSPYLGPHCVKSQRGTSTRGITLYIIQTSTISEITIHLELFIFRHWFCSSWPWLFHSLLSKSRELLIAFFLSAPYVMCLRYLRHFIHGKL